MKLRELRLVIVPLAFFGALAACGPAGGGGDAGTTLEPKLSVIRQEIFQPSCSSASCHGGAGATRGLQLDADDLHAELVGADSTLMGKKYVVAGDPENSLLLQVLKGPVENVSRMPPGVILSDEEIQLVEDWIAAGAQDD